MVMPRVRINAAPSLVLDRHQQLVRAIQGDRVAREDRSVVCDHRVELIAVDHMHGATMEVIAVLHEHECLWSFLGDGINGQRKDVFPTIDGDPHLHPLTDLEPPGREMLAIFADGVVHDLGYQVRSPGEIGAIYRMVAPQGA